MDDQLTSVYKALIRAVKASNGVPSEDDGYNYHHQFSSKFREQAESTGKRTQELVERLTRLDGKQVDDAEDLSVFDGPEPNGRITDFVDALLDDASKQLEDAVKAKQSSSTGQSLKPLENRPQEFSKDASAKKDKESMESKSDMEKPQTNFADEIDNSDAPFVHKLRTKPHALHETKTSAEDEEEEYHPYAPEIRALKYADWMLSSSSDPYEMVSLDDASFLWVDTEDKVQQMMSVLGDVSEKVIAVDLEHHSYRTYLGLVCLMQISTPRQDFLVDTLALRGKLQVLNNVFCDPAKVKVLHGADFDIKWLQRDLGLYIVNLFDTGRAARALGYPRFSLAYLLKSHCDVEADKQYQLSDWRKRPLSPEMTKYAREDTRYLHFIYDRMKTELLEKGRGTEMLLQVLKRSNEICLTVYKKPETSPQECDRLLHKLKDAVQLRQPSQRQYRVFSRLYFWRDDIARTQDESTGYVMPNHVLMRLAKQLPTKVGELNQVCNPVPTFVRKHALEITKMIAEELKAREEEQVPVQEVVKDTVGAPVVMDSEMKEHAPWVSGKRKARSMSPTEVEQVPTMDLTSSYDANALDRVQEVGEMLAKQTFSLMDTEVQEKQSSPRKKVKVEEEKPMPQSLRETYDMPKKPVKKPEIKPTPEPAVKTRAKDFIEEKVDDVAESKPEGFQAFDFASASQQISGADVDLEGKTTEKSKKGYNPFVAVRGGKKGMKKQGRGQKQEKRHQHVPRSSTSK